MDQARIQLVIEKALSDADKTIASQGGAANYNARRVDYAEGYVLAQRSQACGDENLACAQHYLKMRHWVAEIGLPAQPVCVAFIYGYYTFKKALEVIGRPSWAAIGSCDKPSPASFWQTWWAVKGVRDGLDDYYADHPDALDAATLTD